MRDQLSDAQSALQEAKVAQLEKQVALEADLQAARAQLQDAAAVKSRCEALESRERAAVAASEELQRKVAALEAELADRSSATPPSVDLSLEEILLRDDVQDHVEAAKKAAVAPLLDERSELTRQLEEARKGIMSQCCAVLCSAL